MTKLIYLFSLIEEVFCLYTGFSRGECATPPSFLGSVLPGVKWGRFIAWALHPQLFHCNSRLLKNTSTIPDQITTATKLSGHSPLTKILLIESSSCFIPLVLSISADSLIIFSLQHCYFDNILTYSQRYQKRKNTMRKREK